MKRGATRLDVVERSVCTWWFEAAATVYITAPVFFQRVSKKLTCRSFASINDNGVVRYFDAVHLYTRYIYLRSVRLPAVWRLHFAFLSSIWSAIPIYIVVSSLQLVHCARHWLCRAIPIHILICSRQLLCARHRLFDRSQLIFPCWSDRYRRVSLKLNSARYWLVPF